jgi:hypothetical protein
MRTDDSQIINLHKIIKLHQCTNPDCVNEIMQLEQMIEKYNKEEDLKNKYWFNEYTLEKPRLDLIRKNIFSKYIIDGKNIIERRPY